VLALKTTLYGNGKETNEFGIPKEPKETNFVHDISHRAGRRDLPNTSWMMDKAAEFYEANGRYPTRMMLQCRRGGTSFAAFWMDRPGLPQAMVRLDVSYEAEEDGFA
jgi:hypothetical protein